MIEQTVHLLSRQAQSVELVEEAIGGGNDTAGSNATYLKGEKRHTHREIERRKENGLAQYIIAKYIQIYLYISLKFYSQR